MNARIILFRYKSTRLKGKWIAVGTEDPRKFMAVRTGHMDREGTRDGAIQSACDFHIPEPRHK
jgi:hypothetical protein